MFNIIIIFIYNMYTTDNSQEFLLNVALTVHARIEYFLRFETLEILAQVTVVQDNPYTLYRTIWSDITSHNRTLKTLSLTGNRCRRMANFT